MSVIDSRKILTEWDAIIRSEIPFASSLSDEDLEDGLAYFLPALDKFLMHKGRTVELKGPIRAYCKNHGKSRAILEEYELNHVVLEFQVLRKLILESLEKKQGLTPEIRTIVVETIDHGIVGAAIEFTLLRGATQNRVNEALVDKTTALQKLHAANAVITDMGVESEARENYVSALSHDLRNPLFAARLSAQLMMRPTTDPQFLQKHAGRIIMCIDRADRMIKDLLDANKIKSGEPMPVKKVQCSLNKILEDQLDELRTVYGENIQLQLDEEISGQFDPQAVYRIIENLTANAVKYGRENGTVTIKLSSTPENIILSVHNWGNPIPENEQENIFKQFKRAHAAIESSKAGWGIGLTLVKGLAEAHGGSVTLSSSEKEGTTFCVLLPNESASFAGIPQELEMTDHLS